MDPASQYLAVEKLPPGKREMTKSQNRHIILEAAKQVFAELGYGAATVRDIIRATPLASGTFYNYFKSKEEVYLALTEDVAQALRPGLRAVRSSATTVEEFLTGSLKVYFGYITREVGERLFVRDSEPVHFDTPELHAVFDELRADLDAGVTRGLFPAQDTDYLAAAIMGAAIEVARRMIRREPPDVDGAAEYLSHLLTEGVLRPRA